MKKLSLLVKNDVFASMNMAKFTNCLKNYQNGSFTYNAASSKELSEKMQNDALCSQWGEYLIFESEYNSLFQAKIFLRLNEEGLELFNINSKDSQYFELTAEQYNTIVVAFKKYMGESISSLFDVRELR